MTFQKLLEKYRAVSFSERDKASGITNDSYDWAKEHDKPRYILDLLLSVITISLETMKIVAGLPRLGF